MKTQINKNSNWIKIFQPDENAVMRLFCFHYAGGGAFMFRDWVRNLPPQIELIAIQLPGRENRFQEEPLTDVGETVIEISKAVENFFDKPFAFFGHSMGALLAFETARFLSKNNKNIPRHLFVSGRTSPDAKIRNYPIHNLPEELFLKEIQKYGGLPKEILADAEMRAFFFPTLRADMEMCEKYVYAEKPVLNVPITVYGGTNDEGVSVTGKNGWKEMTGEACEAAFFEGGHFFFRDSAEEFFKRLRKDLESLLLRIRYTESASIFGGKPLSN